MSTPALGDRVLYRLRAIDAGKATAWRDNFARSQAAADHTHPHGPGGSTDGGGAGAPGYIAHHGLPLAEGDVVFADVCEPPYTETGRLTLCVNLKGSDTFLVCGVREGDGPGTWTRRP
jgi:hypothetical protein